MVELTRKLMNLKLAGMCKTLESRNKYALSNKISYIEFLELLIEDENANRQSNSYSKRFNKSKLNNLKSLESYDFVCQPELDKKLLMDLASCRYIKEKKNIVFMGNPGVGKTHLANSLGLEALKQGYKVRFLDTINLLENLYKSRGDGSYHNTLKELLDLDLLVIDELGFKKIANVNIDDFFEIIRRRYENASIIITTNRNFEDWGKIFGDAVLASAIIDRLVHHSYIIKITGNSYRVKDLVKEK